MFILPWKSRAPSWRLESTPADVERCTPLCTAQCTLHNAQCTYLFLMHRYDIHLSNSYAVLRCIFFCTATMHTSLILMQCYEALYYAVLRCTSLSFLCSAKMHFLLQCYDAHLSRSYAVLRCTFLCRATMHISLFLMQCYNALSFAVLRCTPL